MEKQYHIDLARYSLQKFKDNLHSRAMIPSRVILKEKLDERFEILANNEISNLKELIAKLKTKGKIAHFAEESGLSVHYLTILKREANSYRPSPIRLDKFPGVKPEYVDRLAAAGIHNTRHLFNLAKESDEREQLAQKLEIPLEIMNELVGLADLGRAYGVGPVFARLLYDVGIKTIQVFVSLTAAEIIRIYEVKEQKKADFGVHEIQFSLELAQDLDIAVEL